MSFTPKGSSAASTYNSPNRSPPEPAAPPIADEATGSQSGPGLLAGTDILVAEDEVIVALEVRDGLEDAGAAIVGPARSVTGRPARNRDPACSPEPIFSSPKTKSSSPWTSATGWRMPARPSSVPPIP